MQTASYDPNSGKIETYEPMIEDSMRQEDLAVGMRNVGNTCYFNSLLQIYYSLPNFVQKILLFKNQDDLQGKDETETKKIKSGLALFQQLQIMFAKMAVGNKSYIDPKPVLATIVDNSGNQFQIGDERDLREFNEIFQQRLSDAILAVEKSNSTKQKDSVATTNE